MWCVSFLHIWFKFAKRETFDISIKKQNPRKTKDTNAVSSVFDENVSNSFPFAERNTRKVQPKSHSQNKSEQMLITIN